MFVLHYSYSTTEIKNTVKFNPAVVIEYSREDGVFLFMIDTKMHHIIIQ